VKLSKVIKNIEYYEIKLQNASFSAFSVTLGLQKTRNNACIAYRFRIHTVIFNSDTSNAN